ncbi:MAG: hypothetical protein K0S07_105 [Chlamydiales bacterium]|nr:hypothetical protein [Chlamydiales bacterium]
MQLKREDWHKLFTKLGQGEIEINLGLLVDIGFDQEALIRFLSDQGIKTEELIGGYPALFKNLPDDSDDKKREKVVQALFRHQMEG